MNSMNRNLDRLLRAAATAPAPETAALPFAVEARVLARWRRGGTVDEWLGLRPVLRRGLACACVLTLAVVALSLREMRHTAAEELAFPNAVVNLALMR